MGSIRDQYKINKESIRESIRESKWLGDFQNGNPNGQGIFKMEIQTAGGFSKWKSKQPGDFQNGNLNGRGIFKMEIQMAGRFSK